MKAILFMLLESLARNTTTKPPLPLRIALPSHQAENNAYSNKYITVFPICDNKCKESYESADLERLHDAPSRSNNIETRSHLFMQCPLAYRTPFINNSLAIKFHIK